jgi:hypothetical protein
MIVLALLAMAVLYIWLVPVMVGTRMRKGVNWTRRSGIRKGLSTIWLRLFSLTNGIGGWIMSNRKVNVRSLNCSSWKIGRL